MYFYYFIIIYPWEWTWPFIWRNLNLLHLTMLCAKFGWNWLLYSREEGENVKRLLTNRPQAIRKAHLSFQCRLANKRPTGLNGHLSIRDSTLTSCQKGTYLHINSYIIEKIKINNGIRKHLYNPLIQLHAIYW